VLNQPSFKNVADLLRRIISNLTVSAKAGLTADTNGAFTRWQRLDCGSVENGNLGSDSDTQGFQVRGGLIVAFNDRQNVAPRCDARGSGRMYKAAFDNRCWKMDESRSSRSCGRRSIAYAGLSRTGTSSDGAIFTKNASFQQRQIPGLGVAGLDTGFIVDSNRRTAAPSGGFRTQWLSTPGKSHQQRLVKTPWYNAHQSRFRTAFRQPL
jgi:hypothetical protein